MKIQLLTKPEKLLIPVLITDTGDLMLTLLCRVYTLFNCRGVIYFRAYYSQAMYRVIIYTYTTIYNPVDN